jgi:hypothetical protein
MNVLARPVFGMLDRCEHIQQSPFQRTGRNHRSPNHMVVVVFSSHAAWLTCGPAYSIGMAAHAQATKTVDGFQELTFLARKKKRQVL